MDISLDDEQRALEATVRSLLDAGHGAVPDRTLLDDPRGFDLALWQRGAALGWCGLFVPADEGGGSPSGRPILDAALVSEVMGRVLYPGPFAAASLLAFAVSGFGSAEISRTVLPGLLGGEVLASCASGASAIPQHDGFELSGTLGPVIGADAADMLLVGAVLDGEHRWFVFPGTSPGLTTSRLEALDLTRRHAEIELDSVRVDPDALLGRDEGSVDELAIVLQLAETVGILDRVFDMTMAWVLDRAAFGRPIGSYQAIKHRLAGMRTVLEASKAAAVGCARSVEEGHPERKLHLSSAKCYIDSQAGDFVQEAIQLHGGIGLTWEHDLHLYLRRVAANASLLGSPDHHRERLCDLLTA